MSTPVFSGDKEAYVAAVLRDCPPRFAELSDVEALVAFGQEVFPEGGTNMGHRSLARDIAGNPIGNEILVLDDAIAAHVQGAMYPSEIDPERCYGDIASISVAADYRGRGLGKLMLGRMIDSMMTEDPTGICLHTRVSNLAMQRLAAKFGFVIEGTEEGYYARTNVPEAAYFMVFRPGEPVEQTT